MSPLVWAQASIVLVLISSVFSLLAGRWPLIVRQLVLPVFSLSGAVALIAGLMGLGLEAAVTSHLPLGLPWMNWQMRLDGLAAFFLCLIGILVLATGIFGRGYVRGLEHGQDSLIPLGIFSGLFVCGMMLVVLADDAFLFMVAWELMSVSSYFLVAYHHEHAANRRAAFIYLLMAHIGGLAILLGYGILAAFGGDFTFEGMRGADLPFLWSSLAFVLAFIGFGMKAGLVPLHAWLPEAHPVAPSHISALMSGVMLKVAVYGFIRFVFDLVGEFHWQWGVVILVIGSVSALMGVLYALMQHDLKRLLAYHSVENIGIIFIGLGLSQIFFAQSQLVIGTLALVAALYHTINHALFKGLLFLGAGVILHSANERDLEKMGGLLRRMPWTGLFFLVGCISISALPPFNGFVSEWLTFQSALQAWQLESGVLRSIVPISAAMLALTGALAAMCFVKVYGVAFLGQARSRHVRRARPAPLSMRLGQAILAILCLLFGVFPSTIISAIEVIPLQIVGQDLGHVSGQSWFWLTPMSPGVASYNAPMLAIILLIVIVAGLWIVGSRIRRVRRCDSWDCGFGQPDPSMQYTAGAFSQPVRRIFGLLFHIEEGFDSDQGDRKRYHIRVGDRIWTLLYLPIAHTVEKISRRVVRLQSGSIRIYLAWSLSALVVLLWIMMWLLR